MSDLSMPPSQQPVVDGGNSPLSAWWVRWLQDLVNRVNWNIRSGTGSPEGVVTGSPGQIWMRTNGGAGAVMYVKETGVNTNTGWAVK